MKTNRRLFIHRFIIISSLIAVGFFFIFITDFSAGRPPKWGVTFSRSYSLDLQLDWRETYLAILDDLDVSHIRLSAYWDEVEANQGEYNFEDLDWQIDQATERGKKIILAVGRRLPRWPECHDPQWIKHFVPQDANIEVLKIIELLVTRYQNNPAIIYWQVENEPLVAWFGFCPPPNEDFLKQEVALVRKLDSRPILLTDSGELSSWQKVASWGDIVGTTLYRIVWNKKMGFLDYWFVPAAFYRFKADFAMFRHPNLQKVIITELQMEPWTFNKHMVELSLKEQQRSFNIKRFKDNIIYAKKTGFPEVYLWGAEYWYWLKKQGQGEIWQEAKKLW